MGRFQDSVQGRRYEALPANGADDDDHEDRESLGVEAASPTAASAAADAAAAAASVTSPRPSITSPVGSGPPPASARRTGPIVASSSASTSSSSPPPSSSSSSSVSTGRSEEASASRDASRDPKQQQEATVAASGDNQADDAASDASAPTTSTPESSASSSSTAAEDLGPDAISVRILDLNGKFFSIACRLEWRVARVKQRVLEATDVPVGAQRLIYRGRVLEDDSALADYKLEDGHTIHLFVRHSQPPEPEAADASATAPGSSSTTNGLPAGAARLDDGLTIVHISSDVVSSAVFPSDSARRVDPLMLDSPLGNCARRVKLWSSFLLIIYTMKVMGQFALLANDQQLRSQQAQAAATDGTGGGAAAAAAAAAAREDERERMYDYPEYYHQDPVAGVVELLIHAFGVYVGGVGFKAAHDTDIRPIRFFCRGVVWLAVLTLAEQVYVTVQIAHSDIPNERVRFAYGAQAPSKDDIVSANIFQAIMLVVMWVIAIRHAYWHQAEVNAYNQSFAAAAMNAVPPAHLPPAELV